MISVEFTQKEKDKLSVALNSIESVLNAKVVNLTPDQCSQYGRIANKTEDWICKVKEYIEKYPALVPKYVNASEHFKDFQSRRDIEPVLNRLVTITEKLDDTQKLISHDLYHNSISFYRSVKLSAQKNIPGCTSVYQDLKE